MKYKLQKFVAGAVLAGLALSPTFALAQTSSQSNLDLIASLRRQIAELQLKVRALVAQEKSVKAEARAEAKASAKVEKEERKQEKRQDKRSEKEDNDDDERECRGRGLAFGHLFAPGWLKNRGSDDCPNSPGFPRATTTPDTIPPVLSAIRVFAVGTSTASVSWRTNELASSTLYYTTFWPVTAASSSVMSDNTFLTEHRFDLSGLATSTFYYAKVSSADASGNIALSSAFAFRTGQ